MEMTALDVPIVVRIGKGTGAIFTPLMAKVTLWFERQGRGVPVGVQRQLVVGDQ